MFNILLPIDARDCKKILLGSKTIEIRKSMPVVKFPIRCYILCKNPVSAIEKLWKTIDNNYYISEERKHSSDKCCSGFVIGEFICDYSISYIYHVENENTVNNVRIISDDDLKAACMTRTQFNKYSGYGDAYGWHINAVTPYTEFREITSFKHTCKWFASEYDTSRYCRNCKYLVNRGDNTTIFCAVHGDKVVTKIPKHWCYVHDS